MYINKVRSKNSGFTNVAIASAITAKARIRLYHAFKDVLSNGGRLLYCDTDSIVASFKDQSILNVKNASGLFFDKNKDDTIIKKSWFASAKTYSIVLPTGINITKIKGVPKNTISCDTFIALFKNNKPLRVVTQPILYKKNYIYNTGILTKTIKLNNYKKRIFLDSYTKTAPLQNVHTTNSESDR